MKRIADGLVKGLAEPALLNGAGLTAAGTRLIYLPAGLIAGGLLAMAKGVLSLRSREKGDDAI